MAKTSRLLKASPKKKTRISGTIQNLMDEKHMGTEPLFKDKEASNLDVGRTLTWYGYMYDQNHEKAKAFIMAFLKDFREGYDTGRARS